MGLSKRLENSRALEDERIAEERKPQQLAGDPESKQHRSNPPGVVRKFAFGPQRSGGIVSGRRPPSFDRALPEEKKNCVSTQEGPETGDLEPETSIGMHLNSGNGQGFPVVTARGSVATGQKTLLNDNGSSNFSVFDVIHNGTDIDLQSAGAIRAARGWEERFLRIEIYQHLRDSEIRLVNLQSGSERDTMKLGLFVADLKALPDFEALSYVVGVHDTSQSVGLVYKGKTTLFPISMDLKTALKALRLGDRDRLLWIDAISINQHDKAERSAQIKKMGQIFHAASSVCIWLGPDTIEDQSEDAMRFIPRVLDFKTLDETLKSAADKPRRLALSKLMTRDWFRRRWVVQEMALAKNATVYCGASSVPWADFAAAAAIFESRWLAIREAVGWEDAEELGDVHVPGASSLVNISSGVFHKDAWGNIAKRCFDLETLLAILPTFAVTQPLDFVYSILSLGRDTYNLENLTIPIDYSLSLKHVFVKVVEHIINFSDSLDIICRPWAPSCALPSWIPTVDNYAYVRRNDGQYERENADSLLGLPGRPIYAASGRRSFPEGIHITWIGDEPVLAVRGHLLGDIEEIGERCVNGNIPRDWHSIGEWDPTASQVPDAYWRTLVAERGFRGEQPPAWFRDVCTHSFKQNASRDVDTSRLMRKLKTSHTTEFLRRVQLTTWNRRLFRTTVSNCGGKGATLGLGPPGTKLGDQVIILQGCSVPVIVRGTLKPAGTWTLVGACFVHGQMDSDSQLEQRFGRVAGEFSLS